MYYEIERSEFGKVAWLYKEYPKDPMMYSILEENQAGRVFVDHPYHPTAALIWTGMEYAYLSPQGESATFLRTLKKLITEVILLAVDQAGLGFVSVLNRGEADRQALIKVFKDRKPVSYGINTYAFDPEMFWTVKADQRVLPTEFLLLKLDQMLLNQPNHEFIREDIVFCWESLNRYLELGLGYSIQHQGKVVSSCYAIAYGADAYHINIQTNPEHRQSGLAKHAAMAFLDSAFSDGKTVYWINDTPNIASRKLAQSLGFVYRGDIYPVDIPAQPYNFHLGLAHHFYTYLERYDQAVELYENAFSFQAGDENAYINAAKAWAMAGHQNEALDYLRLAVEKGLDNLKEIEGEVGFEELREMTEWDELI
jgi:RimJ/RimL family protein N-acetyltransferase